MSFGDIMFIILFFVFCIDMLGSFVMMILAYKDKKRQIDYVRQIIRLKEYEVFGWSGEVKE